MYNWKCKCALRWKLLGSCREVTKAEFGTLWAFDPAPVSELDELRGFLMGKDDGEPFAFLGPEPDAGWTQNQFVEPAPAAHGSPISLGMKVQQAEAASAVSRAFHFQGVGAASRR